MREIHLRTERRTQLLDITPQVEEALNGADCVAAALVYVPHTTAGVTINEDIDPELANDLEQAMEKIVEDGWSWRHDDADGPNAPSHEKRQSSRTPRLPSTAWPRACAHSSFVRSWWRS